MRVFVDTEFNGSRDPAILVSIGLVTDDGQEFYAELPPQGMHLNGVPDIFLRQVVGQFGKIAGARVSDRIEMSDRVTAFLTSLNGQLEVFYEDRLDWRHLETLIANDRSLMARVRPNDVAGQTTNPASTNAGAAALAACAPRGIGRHHALADALVLHSAWKAR